MRQKLVRLHRLNKAIIEELGLIAQSPETLGKEINFNDKSMKESEYEILAQESIETLLSCAYRIRKELIFLGVVNETKTET